MALQGSEAAGVAGAAAVEEAAARPQAEARGLRVATAATAQTGF